MFRPKSLWRACNMTRHRPCRDSELRSALHGVWIRQSSRWRWKRRRGYLARGRRHQAQTASRKILKGSTGLFRLVRYMDEKSLDQLLRLRGESVRSSSLPPNFQQNVRREIRQRRPTEVSGFGMFYGWQWLRRPPFVTAMLAIAMLVGVGLGSRQPDRIALSTRQALHLEVFGASAPALPSTMLSAKL